MRKLSLLFITLIVCVLGSNAQNPAELAGTYIERSFNGMGYYACQDGVEIAFPSDGVITIKNLQGRGTTLRGSVDWTTGELEFPCQVITSGSTVEMDDNGNEHTINVDVMLSADSIPTPVKGKIGKDGSITLDRWIGETYFDGYGWDWTYEFDILSTSFVKANGKMETVDLDGKKHSYNVHLEYSDDNSKLLVSNFGGKGAILIDVRSSKSLAINPGQYFYFYNFYYGFASLYYPSINDGKVEGINSIRYIRGTGTEDQLNLERWIVCYDLSTAPAKPEWVTTSTVITRTDGGKFLYPEPIAHGWDGSGTKLDPYRMNSADDFNLLAKKVAEGEYFDGSYFRMDNDVDFNGSEFNGVANGMETTNATNIRFEGVFDGNNHVIKNLHIGDQNTNHAALFGELRGTVQNLIVDASCSFVGNDYVGSIAGDMKTTTDAKIINCRNYAPVTGYGAYIGGLAGQMAYGHEMIDSYNAGTITTFNCKVGGLVGSLFRATVRNSQNDGEVRIVHNPLVANNPLLAQAGGIAGYNCGVTVDNCLNTGTVRGLNKCGGILGEVYNSIFTSYINNTVNLGTVICDESGQIGAVIAYLSNDCEPVCENTYYDAQKLYCNAVQGESYAGVTAVGTADLISGQFSSLSPIYWEQAEGLYPALKTFDNASAFNADGRSCYVVFAEGENAGAFSTKATIGNGVTATLEQGNAFYVEGNTLYAPESDGVTAEDVLVLTKGAYSTIVPLRKISNRTLSGRGMNFDPYLINDADDWFVFARMANLEGETFKGKFIKIVNDIDFTGMKYQIPYQSTSRAFEGNLNGNGKTFSGIECDLGTLSSASTCNQGLIVSKLGASGKISALTLSDSKISGFEYIGGMVGLCEGTLSNCNTTKSVTVLADNRYAGGIAGQLSGEAIVEGCANYATVWSESYVGGIAGDGFDVEPTSTITDSYNYGHITNYRNGREGVSFVAGFIPRYKGQISSSENYGEIESINSYAAGIVNTTYSKTVLKQVVNHGPVTAHADMLVSGTAAGITNDASGTITECGNTGTVWSKLNYAGGIASTATCNLTNCWNTGKVFANIVDAGGITAIAEGSITLSHCWNTGEVAAGYSQTPATQSDNAGGLIGTGIATIEYCWNGGYVHVDKNPGPDGTADYDEDWDFTNAGGLVGYGTPKISNSFNTGTVKSKKQTGGLVGQVFFDDYFNGSITNSYNAGAVICGEEAYQNFTNHLIGGDPADIMILKNVFFDYEADNYDYPSDEKYEDNALSHSEMLATTGNITSMGSAYNYSYAATLPALKDFAPAAELPTNWYSKYTNMGLCNHAIATASIEKLSDGSYILSQPADADLVWDVQGGLQIVGNKAIPTSKGLAILTVGAAGTDFTKTFKVNVEQDNYYDSITEIADNDTDNAVIYSVSGQKIAPQATAKGGVYIKNGKKIVLMR